MSLVPSKYNRTFQPSSKLRVEMDDIYSFNPPGQILKQIQPRLSKFVCFFPFNRLAALNIPLLIGETLNMLQYQTYSCASSAGWWLCANVQVYALKNNFLKKDSCICFQI